MKKKMLSLVAVLIMGMLLCSCSGGSQEKMFGVKLPSGEKLTLYMSRDKAEELMVEYESEYKDMEYQDGIDVGIVVSKDNNEVQYITIADVHSVLMRDYEE